MSISKNEDALLDGCALEFVLACPFALKCKAINFSSRRSRRVRSIRPASRRARRASRKSSVSWRRTPPGWKPWRYGAEERMGVLERGRGEILGEGDATGVEPAGVSAGDGVFGGGFGGREAVREGG